MIKVKLIKRKKITPGNIPGFGNSSGYAPSSSTGSSAWSSFAEEAKHAQSAATLDEDSPVNDRFIRKDQDDTTPNSLTVKKDLTVEQNIMVGEDITVKNDANVGNDITVEKDSLIKGDSEIKGSQIIRENQTVKKNLTVEEIATFFDLLKSKEFLSGLNGGFGWQIDNKGNAELESLRVRSFMEIAELIVNRMEAIEGDQLLTEGDTIEECTLNDDGTYTLKLHEKWDGYFTAQHEHNVIKGIFNNITNQITGEGTTTIHGATYFTSWMNVLSVNSLSNTIRVSLYADDEVPAGRNFPPCEMMKIARWGNSGSAENEEYAMRQSCIELSSTGGRIIKYMNVTKPIVDAGNVAFCIGSCPEFLLSVNKDLKEGDNVAYFNKLLASQFINVEYQGRPQATPVFRGAWDAEETYYDGTELTDYDDYGRPVYERSVVEYWGLQWICNTAGTHTAPSLIGTAWTFYQGDTSLILEFDSDETSVWMDDPQITLSLTCRISTCDLTDSSLIRWDWTRESEHGGVIDASSDEIWNAAHSNVGNTMTLLKDDMNYSFGKAPDRLVYTVTATLLDAEGRPAQILGRRVLSSMEFQIKD